jgi:hypothetical protein
MFAISQAPYPKEIRFLRTALLSLTLLFSLWNMWFEEGTIPINPSFLLLYPHWGWNLLWQPLTSACLLPYPAPSLSMLFDLIFLNFIITPIASFVFSFQSRKGFFTFLSFILTSGTLAFLLVGGMRQASLCSGFFVSVVVFWTLIHKKNGSSFLIGIPLSPPLVMTLTFVIALAGPLFASEWGKVVAIIVMAISSYLWAVCRWRLRSSIPFLSRWENSLEKISSWYIGKPLRAFFSFLGSLTRSP